MKVARPRPAENTRSARGATGAGGLRGLRGRSGTRGSRAGSYLKRGRPPWILERPSAPVRQLPLSPLSPRGVAGPRAPMGPGARFFSARTPWDTGQTGPGAEACQECREREVAGPRAAMYPGACEPAASGAYSPDDPRPSRGGDSKQSRESRRRNRSARLRTASRGACFVQPGRAPECFRRGSRSRCDRRPRSRLRGRLRVRQRMRLGDPGRLRAGAGDGLASCARGGIAVRARRSPHARTLEPGARGHGDDRRCGRRGRGLGSVDLRTGQLRRRSVLHRDRARGYRSGRSLGLRAGGPIRDFSPGVHPTGGCPRSRHSAAGDRR